MEAGPSDVYLSSPKHSWWSTQTTKEKRLIIICGIASVLTIIFFMCTVILGTRTRYELNCASSDNNTSENKTPGRIKVCTTTECRQTAFHMRMNMNEDADPCQNFYDLACGGFDLLHEKGESTRSVAGGEFYKRFSSILENFVTGRGNDVMNPTASVFKSCMNQENDNENGVKAIKEMIKEVLGTDWPMGVGKAWDEKKFDYNKSLAKLVKIGLNYIDSKEEYPKNFFLSLSVKPDTKNYKQYMAVLLGPLSPLQIPANLKAIVCKLYPNCTSNSQLDKDIEDFKSVNKDKFYYSMNASDRMEDHGINKIMRSTAEGSEEGERYTIEQLTDLFPQVQWNTFFQTIFEDAGLNIPSNFQIVTIIETLNIFKNVNEEKRLLANAIAFSVAMKWGPLFSTEIERMSNPKQVRIGSCYEFLESYLGFAFGKLYIDEYLPKTALEEISGITHDLINGFRKLIVNASWLDTSTREKAIEKVNNMVSVVASPAWVFNDTTMKEFYKTVTDVQDDSFIVSSRASVHNFFNQRIKLLSSTMDKTNFWTQKSAIEANAFYYLITNSMHYPLGMLMRPFFSPGRHRAIKFGSLGFVAGHEITHGFDSKGRKYDKNGMESNWWDAGTAMKFENGAKCFVDQYSSIRDEQSGKNLDGVNTLAENIADNGGLRAAYQAYKSAPEDSMGKLIGLETYTEDQLFFIAAAQTWCSTEEVNDDSLKDAHAPEKYRAYVPLLNIPEFSKAFHCEKGTPMNPDTKCEIW